ncbi:NAD+ synthase [Thalassolituus sp.]|uniref:NAD+ synthase n=1 Tax=Thalassolituus sp. TaxID=2030822 RepID=UPI002A81BAC1|nr:NAD+ synthase [Thalassolituus sp.]|tara:strand:+ start:26 stop:1648 length:1623 start_codon:yes stop_codon:yes gene_type:complete
MTQSLNIALAQCNFLVGDIPGNTALICQQAAEAAVAGADLIVFSELALTGYPPEDLLLRPSLQRRIDSALEQIAAASNEIAIAIGYPWMDNGALYNCAGVWYQGEALGRYAKQYLPNYQVFDEKRYFAEGIDSCVIPFRGHQLGLTVCEDVWFDGPVDDAVAAGATLILNLNASPFHMGKLEERVELMQRHATRCQVPLLYVNQVGGQDELVFDGSSFAISADAHCVLQMPSWQSALGYVQLKDHQLSAISASQLAREDDLASLYQALVLGVRDYVNKNRFPGVVLGLSGGIDSALTLAIAADALGPERVRAVMMPFTYTSDMSKTDASLQAEAMGIRYESISIEPMYREFMAGLSDNFAGLAVDTTEENLQSRCRGVLLMALSNKTGYMVLTTGNKSEMAVGYATLYGDMAGGYGALKDVYKTKVFALADYRNSISPIIPQRVIDRPPSAELAPDQKDEDSLPPYPVLDSILERYIEHDDSADSIVAAGYEREDVMRVIRLVDVTEYKRRQAPIGVRVTRRGFGRDRRYPVTNGWKAGV